MIKIAINGFGRIGKSFLRSLLTDEKAQKIIDLVAINVGPADPSAIAYAIKYDTLMGNYTGPITYKNSILQVGPYILKVFAEKQAERLPWKALNIDWVVDCSGHYTHSEKAQEHIAAGACKVLISAPAKDPDVTIIPGVNDSEYCKNNHRIVSLGSCTTNALVPCIKIIESCCSIESVIASTIHSYTNSQALLDGIPTDNDYRRSRAAAENIIPTSTGANKLVDVIFPHLQGKVFATALRVPVSTVSFLDVVWVAEKDMVWDNVHNAVKDAQKNIPGIVIATDDPVVSSDLKGASASLIIDVKMCYVQKRMGRLCGWYDNEWGYSCRLKDFLLTHG